jgi:hypothetical protein
MKRARLPLFVVFMLATASLAAHASSTILLNFAGLKDLEPVSNFYNGGSGGFGSMSPNNFGITFSSNALAIKSYLKGGSGGFVLPPTGTPALFFNSGTSGYLNVASGFSTGINFFYAAGAQGTVTVWSGANGTGSVLATITLGVNSGITNGCSGFPSYCNWTAVGLTFSGTGKSVTFSGPANQIGVTDITLGSSRTGVPEPSSLLLFGTGLVIFSSSQVRRLFRRAS